MLGMKNLHRSLCDTLPSACALICLQARPGPSVRVSYACVTALCNRVMWLRECACVHAYLCVVCAYMMQAFSTLGGSDTEALSADKLKGLVNLFDLNADQFLSSSGSGQVVSASVCYLSIYADVY